VQSSRTYFISYPTAPPGFKTEWIDISIALSAIDQQQAAICRLPVELLPDILQRLELREMFALSSSCKLLYGRILNRATFKCGIRQAMTSPDGALRWIYPLVAFRKEWNIACDAMETWLSHPKQQDAVAVDIPAISHSDLYPDNTSRMLPLFNPRFPMLAFLRAYYSSEQMRARRRRWDIIKQFDVLWTDYRRDGWEGDVFVPPGTAWNIDDGLLRCSHPPID
jgi:hypothetical protein